MPSLIALSSRGFFLHLQLIRVIQLISFPNLRPELCVHHTNAVIEKDFVSGSEVSPSYDSVNEPELVL